MAELSFFDRVATHTTHVPDVLSCIANLSNDEVFTPPDVVNKMLDLLPQELFADPKTTFLDPATKTGVFLREIAKRCLDAQLPGYKERSLEITEKKRLDIPLDEYDIAFEKQLQEKIDHIFHNQLFGIGITELTSLLARRSLYCSKYPNGPYSITHFDDAEGNIRFRRTEHTWDSKKLMTLNGKKMGKCVFCGASREVYDRGDVLESHAYEFIHTVKPEEIFKMQFDVIIGNPPYQLSDESESASATPIYNKFVEQAKKLNPRYLTMIIPSRWMSGGKGLDAFRDTMIHDKHITKLVDYFDSTQCFSGVSVKGGICFFLRERDRTAPCEIKTILGDNIITSTRELVEDGCDVFIRWNEGVSIFHKVQNFKEQTFDKLVSSRKPFGIDAKFKKYASAPSSSTIKVYCNKEVKNVLLKDIPSNRELVDKYKIYISRGYGAGEVFPHQIINKPFIGEKNSCCSETYVVVYPTNEIDVLKNIVSYMQTKFFRFMVLLCKNTQDASAKVYRFVPVQDFSKPWTDEELYAKYGLTDEEIEFIESMIKPMDLDGGAE